MFWLKPFWLKPFGSRFGSSLAQGGSSPLVVESDEGTGTTSLLVSLTGPISREALPLILEVVEFFTK